jgi:hypothetical protein
VRLGAGVSGAPAQWGPAPALLPYAVHVALSVAAAVPLLRTPETVVPDLRRPLLRDPRVPPAAGSPA